MALPPGRPTSSLLEALDRTLRDFVAAHSSVAVALVAEDRAASAAVAAPDELARRLDSVLAGVLASSPDLELLFVHIAWDGGAAAIRLAAPTPDSVLHVFGWPLR